MSNPDWPGPYWREHQDDAGAGWRGRQNGLPQDRSPWDDNAGFWRADDRSPGRASEPSQTRRPSRHGADGRGARRSRSAADAGPRRTPVSDPNGREGNAGRFSQTAGELRSRFGMRGSAGPSTGRGSLDDGRTQARRDPDLNRGGYRGSRRAGGATAAFGDQGGGRAGLTAVRDRTGTTERVGHRTGTGPGHDDGRPGGLGRGRRGGGGWDGGGSGGNFNGQPLTRGQRFKQWLLYGSWWRHWTWKKVLGVMGGGIAALILFGILGIIIVYEMTPVPNATAETANWQSSNVYFSNGQLLGTFVNSGINRQLLTTGDIPKTMTDAITAAEDRAFYTEGGISVSGLLRSAYEDVFGNGNLQGGSTITMQYAKNYYNDVNTGRNVSTKLKEIFIAMKLAHSKSKSWIMTNYLNTVYFGSDAYGVGAAAETYFDVNLTSPHATLTVPQAAMLAAMVNEPSVFDPNPDAGPGYTALVARYEYVLTNMARDGNITQAHAVSYAKAFPKITPGNNTNGWTGYKGYLMSMVEQELEAPRPTGYGLTAQQLATGGYKITTTLSMARVNELARSVNEEKAAMKAAGVPFPVYDRIGAVLENARTGAIIAVYGGPGYSSNAKWCGRYDCYYNMAEVPEPVGSSFKPYVLSSAVSQDMNVFTSKLNGYGNIWIPEKPADTPAIELTLSRLGPPPGVPANAVGGYLGDVYYYHFPDGAEPGFGKPLSPPVAAAMSSDPAFEDLAHRDGIQNVINMAGDFGVGQSAFVLPCSGQKGSTIQDTLTYCNDLTGVNSLNAEFSPTQASAFWQQAQLPGSVQIALGEAPLTAVEQATTFATLADDGVYHSPHVVASVVQLGTGKELSSDVVTRIPLSPAAAADVDYALSFDNNSPWGTAEGTVSFRRGGVIAKTGTLGGGALSSEAWFNGATPNQYALSVALFTNDPANENIDNLPGVNGEAGSVGGGWPATIWNNFMTTEFGNESFSPVTTVFPPVNGAPFVPWIQVNAQQVTPKCQPGRGHAKNCKACLPIPGQPCSGGPSPGPSCGPFGGQCGSPAPSPSCGPFDGQQCGSPSPSPSPSPTPSCSPNPITHKCNKTSPGGASQPGAAGTTAAAGLATVSEEVSALSGGLMRVLLGSG